MKLLSKSIFMVQLRELSVLVSSYAKYSKGSLKDEPIGPLRNEQKRDSTESKRDRLIHQRFAESLIKRLSKKTFQDKEWAYENLHEVFWTILYQRPNLREDIIAVCKSENEEYADYWQRISTANAPMADVPRDIPMVTGDPLDNSIAPGGAFLTFPKEFSSRTCFFFMRELTFVNTAKLVTEMSADIERRADRPDGVMLALDAEWSAYESYAAASILQIALDDVVYIVDIDVLPRDILRPFIEKIFTHPKIFKLGFYFNDDLRELRKAKSLKDCAALDGPKNLSCVLKMVVALIEESQKRSNAAEILEEFGVSIGPSGNKKNEMKEITEDDSRAVPRPRLKFSPSLSSLCKSLLGLPLDKRETLSVWTRRPLRALQLRYAAMDAFCLILLHDRCKKWAEKLEMPMEKIVMAAEKCVEIKR